MGAWSILVLWRQCGGLEHFNFVETMWRQRPSAAVITNFCHRARGSSQNAVTGQHCLLAPGSNDYARYGTPLIHIGPRSEDEESRGPDDARHGTDDRNLPYTTMCQLCLRACARVCMCGHGIGRGTTTTSESAATLILSVVSG